MVKEIYTILGKKYHWGPDIDFDKEVVLDHNGVRYTNARIDEMVREIEEFGPYVGRPSLTAPAVHSPEVKARVPKSLKKRLEAEAKRRGKTPSVLIRQALEEFLKNSNSKE
jgi:hypothetical protein